MKCGREPRAGRRIRRYRKERPRASSHEPRVGNRICHPDDESSRRKDLSGSMAPVEERSLVEDFSG